jgi:hypothetical protein
MSATTINICPYCEYTSTKGFEQICPACGRILRGPKDSIFESPNYLYKQKKNLLKVAENDKLNPEKFSLFNLDLTSKLHMWSRQCTTEDKMAVLFDAALVLENIIHSQTPVTDLRTIIQIAKKIGTLGNVIEEYFKAGGSPYDREVRQLLTDNGNGVGNQAAAPAGRY